MRSFTDKQIVEGIRKKDNEVLEWVYSKHFTPVKRFVIKTQGNLQDAQDVFQEGLVTVYRKVTGGAFKPENSFATFLFSICKNLWLKELRNKTLVLRDEIVFRGTDFHPVDTESYSDIRRQLVHKYLLRMDPECREMLFDHNNRLSNNEIIDDKECVSHDTLRKRKSRCMQKLLDMIRKDPLYKRFLEQQILV